MGNDFYKQQWLSFRPWTVECCRITIWQMTSVFLTWNVTFPFYIIVPWNGIFFTTAHGHCSHAPLSAILIWDKNQSSTLENSISLMRYEYSSERKSQVVGCFQTNPLKVIWSSAANYRAFWAASHLHRAPPPPFPTYPPTAPLSVHHIPSLCFRSLFSVAVLLLRCWELTGGHCGPIMRGSRNLSAT